MPENIAQGPMIHWLFFMTTILFMIVTILQTLRIKKLQEKNESLMSNIAEKERELIKNKPDPRSFLLPYDNEKSKSIVVSVNKKHKITYANDYALELFKYEKHELINKDIFKTIYEPIDSKNELEENIINRIFANPNLYMEHESENLKKDGEKIWISWTNRVVYDETGKPEEIRSVGFDISKRKRLESALTSLSSTDEVTGTLNRQTFLDKGALELRRANQYKRQLSLLVMQLDCYKSTSSAKPEPFSDDLLNEVVQMTKKASKETDIIGRISDVEFAIILPETGSEKAQFFAEQLKNKIQSKNLKAGLCMFITVSFGIASKNKKDETIDALLQNARASLINFEKTKSKTERKKKERK